MQAMQVFFKWKKNNLLLIIDFHNDLLNDRHILK